MSRFDFDFGGPGGTAADAAPQVRAAAGDGGRTTLSLNIQLDAADVLGAAQVDALDSDYGGGAAAAISFDVGAVAAADAFDFGPGPDLPDPHPSPDALADLIRLILFLRSRMDDTYTSGQGENGVVSDFNVTIKFEGDSWTDALRDRFIQASEYLSTIITGDLADELGIDDVQINASIVDIDGAGGILGQAGPTLIRDPDMGSLTLEGIMEFDVADAEDFDAMGLFNDIVLHEMMHVLGVGTLWDLLGLVTGSVRSGDMRFVGENAMLAFETEFGDIFDPSGVPVETDGGSGTAGGHWDEDTFGNEIMTGYLNSVETYVSSMTIASLEDLGYETIWDASDPTAAVPQLDDILIA